ncbi:hypothetical protein MRX96_004716 [Rhipicephalus microplus]
MDGAPIILTPTSTDATRHENHKRADITTTTKLTSPKHDEKEVKKDGQHGLTYPEDISTSHNPGYASFVDESDMVVLRLLELLHSVLLFGMKLLKSHGRYAYSAS